MDIKLIHFNCYLNYEIASVSLIVFPHCSTSFLASVSSSICSPASIDIMIVSSSGRTAKSIIKSFCGSYDELDPRQTVSIHTWMTSVMANRSMVGLKSFGTAVGT